MGKIAVQHITEEELNVVMPSAVSHGVVHVTGDTCGSSTGKCHNIRRWGTLTLGALIGVIVGSVLGCCLLAVDGLMVELQSLMEANVKLQIECNNVLSVKDINVKLRLENDMIRLEITELQNH
ncbi:unnamed protein product [Didymodactylos carnosus]|uniref:Uncharacterized protein n=1 Tax=Didymodactylos carnosus TaxID=1234261 RepID=A0A814W7S4_9BILA|nr:unnamed protein product [Didymodactylos carnosus]CAF3963386.1 unnamed protein product [Didymodactylos carnosus]